MRFVELFAGAGGLSLGLERAGLRCVAHAEIETHARAVLRRRWPDVPLFGDVTTLTGADLPPCDLLSGGSPCQDLSVAGKRAGLVDGARSSLFFHQARLWTECGAPYLLWENVAGALSSNAGRDFALVLSTLVGAPIAVPGDGWRRGGVASGPAAVAAWRVCDLRYFGRGGFGPPQRRVRVFVLAARAGGADPAEILALRQGVCGHPDPRSQAGEGAAAEVGASVAGSRWRGDASDHCTDLDNAGCYPVQSFGWDRRNVTSAANRTRVTPGMVGTLHNRGVECCQSFQPMTFRTDQEPELSGVGLAPTLDRGSSSGGGQIPGVLQPMSFKIRGRADGLSCEVREDGVVSSLLTPTGGRSGTGAGDAVTQPLAYDDRSQATNAEVHHTLRGEGIGARVSDAVIQPLAAPTLTAHDAKGPGSYRDGALQNTVVTERPRRLMPLECERLMGWPDDHTAEGVDEQGRPYRLKDTPRYRLCGNGVGAPQAEWIGRRLVEALAGCPA